MEKGDAIQPINEVDSQHVKVQIDFPAGMDLARRIGLNVQLLEQLCRIAGILHLTIKTSKEDSGTSQVIITGHDNNGHAYGGFVQAKDMTSSELEPLGSSNQLTFRVDLWDSARITIDLERIIQEISSTPRGLRDAKKWSKLLENTIKTQLRNLGTKATLQKEKYEIPLNTHVICFIISFTFTCIFVALHLGVIGHFNSEYLLSLTPAIPVLNIMHYWALMSIVKNPQRGDRRQSSINILGKELDNCVSFNWRLYFSSLIQEIVPTENNPPLLKKLQT